MDICTKLFWIRTVQKVCLFYEWNLVQKSHLLNTPLVTQKEEEENRQEKYLELPTKHKRRRDILFGFERFPLKFLKGGIFQPQKRQRTLHYRTHININIII